MISVGAKHVAMTTLGSRSSPLGCMEAASPLSSADMRSSTGALPSSHGPMDVSLNAQSFSHRPTVLLAASAPVVDVSAMALAVVLTAALPAGLTSPVSAVPVSAVPVSATLVSATPVSAMPVRATLVSAVLVSMLVSATPISAMLVLVAAAMVLAVALTAALLGLTSPSLPPGQRVIAGGGGLVVALLLVPEAPGVQGHGVVVVAGRRVVEEGVHDVLLCDLSSDVLLVR